MEVEKAQRYLNDIEWPKDLRVDYVITQKWVILRVNKFDFTLLPPEDVVKATETINKTMTWLNSNALPAVLEAV